MFEADGGRTNSTVAANPSCYTTCFWLPRSTLDSNFQQEVFPSPLITCIRETASHYSHKRFSNSSFKFRRVLTERPEINQAWSSQKPARFPRRFQEASSESLQWLHAPQIPRNTKKRSGTRKSSHNIHTVCPTASGWHSCYCLGSLHHEQEAERAAQEATDLPKPTASTCQQVAPASPFSNEHDPQVCVTQPGSQTPVAKRLPQGSEPRERPRRARGSPGGVQPHDCPGRRAGWERFGRSRAALVLPSAAVAAPLPPLPQRSPPQLGSPSSPRPRDLAGTPRPPLARAAAPPAVTAGLRAQPPARYRNAPITAAHGTRAEGSLTKALFRIKVVTCR